ncbi:ATP-dependent helicase [Rhodohalobacter barkolensis]|uniref:DNA 3'-5' helicase n=1 Tax=Rhodohalobacter barkolensis TaxID=2053187 RepID=A0A2N0VK27_9BACT|nr:UvrD-helicase domain-containing protein [Rhodohalobacter barkolensis]PKD44545.1 ATP-dependent helicase [Rhodohalobacter barkolensis]
MKKFVLSRDDLNPSDYSIEYEELLNEAQYSAVMHDRGPVLLVAGAGTGKTRTLVYRVARLVESGVDPSQILLLTFTRRSAHEMLRRASQILDERCQRVEGGTFHHYCSKLLHLNAESIGYPENFTIIDASDAMDAIHLVRSRMDIPKEQKRFPKKLTLYSIISSSINKQRSIRQTIEDEYPQFISHLEKIDELNSKYQDYKELNYVMDFDDLLVKTRDLLLNNDEIRTQVASKNRHVLVDEYQDTNALQAELTRLLSSYHKNVMAVGDDAQSIYSFRGADHKNMMRFPELFENTKIIKLEENYRSTQRILDVANRVLEEAQEKFDKKLYTNNEQGDLPGLVKAANMNDQSRFLTQMILNLREQGSELSDIAVLFRNGRDSFDLEVMLNKKDIPYIKYGGQKFTEAAHVKDVLAHLRVLLNPKDAISWNRILLLIDGIGPKTAEDLFSWAHQNGNPFRPENAPNISERYLTQLKALGDLFSKLKQLKGSVPEQLQAVVDYYSVFCKKRFDDHPKRMKDLETFVDISGTYRSLETMVEEIALDPIEATAIETEASQKDESPLILSTIHSAKGLEWRTVFLIQCLDGILPSGYALDDEDQLDEEVRLLYVAVTRAKEQLFITYPALFQSRYGDYFSNPSRFIDELSDELIEPWLLVEDNEASQQSQIEDKKDRLEN